MNKLEAMQTFVRVAEAGSFVAVAEEMHVARSAVTRQIAALETHLGVKLITRSTRRLALTSEGAAYLEQCRVILNLVEAAESGVTERRAELRGRIRVGLPLSFGLQVLSPVLLDFAAEHPLVDLMMDLSDERANLIEEGLDIAIRITADLQPGDVIRRLGHCRLLTLASADYLRRAGEPQHPADLEEHECLIYASDATPASWSFREDGRDIRVAVRGRLVANNGVILADACARGMGIARQPDFIAASYVKSGVLQPILSSFESAPLGIYAVLPGHRYVPHRVRVLMQHIADRLS